MHAAAGGGGGEVVSVKSAIVWAKRVSVNVRERLRNVAARRLGAGRAHLELELAAGLQDGPRAALGERAREGDAANRRVDEARVDLRGVATVRLQRELLEVDEVARVDRAPAVRAGKLRGARGENVLRNARPFAVGAVWPLEASDASAAQPATAVETRAREARKAMESLIVGSVMRASPARFRSTARKSSTM